MHGLIALQSAAAAAAVAEYGAAHGWTMEVAASLEDAERLSRFRRYAAVICDDSFQGTSCAAGLGIARAAKRVDRGTRTIVLATSLSTPLSQARQGGDIDVILMKPQPLAVVYAHAERLLDTPPPDETAPADVIGLAPRR